MLETLSSTKQSSTARKESVYRYYAGYPLAFVDSLLDHLKVRADATVLDPWNGAGTTTEACSRRGIRSIGIDVNPFMQIVATVRSSSRSELGEMATTIAAALEKTTPESDVVGPHVAAVSLLRRIEDQAGIRRDLPAALFIFANAARAIFQTVRTKNPTWFSHRKADAIRSSEQEIKIAALRETNKLREWAVLQPQSEPRQPPTLITGDARSVWVGKRVDHVVTSPPYLTRIDYAQKTLPELLFLAQAYGLDYEELRRSMLGTVLTVKDLPPTHHSPLPTAQVALTKIAAHQSKASGTYYLHFFQAYFEGLLSTLGHILPLVADSGTVTLVTQGSYYKELYIDLPQIVREAMEFNGFFEFESRSFTTATHMALINTRTFASKQSAPSETVSTFRRCN